MSDEPTAVEPEVPAPPEPTITVTFTPEFGVRLATSPNVQLAHLWAAAAYLARIADQAHADQHMAALAQTVQQAQRPAGLVIPRDHLPKRRI